jgi:mannose-6-phosphate isomerase-like protein (cupin superfamily)
MKTLALVLLGAAIALPAGSEPKGFEHWNASQLKDIEKDLSAKISGKPIAGKVLADFDNHSIQVSYREGEGEAELHETLVDIFFVQNGQAILTIGGEVIEPKTIRPHEIRGRSIKGGENKKLSAGDLVHVPAGLPHQLKVDSGSHFTYYVVKVESK